MATVVLKAALLVCIVTSEPNREISRCITISPPYTGDMLIAQTIYYHYLFRRYVFVRHGDQVQVNLSPDDLLEETRKSLPNFKATRQQMSGKLENHWTALSIPNEVAEFLKDHPRDEAGALNAIPPRYRTDGDKERWRGRINIWMNYSYLGVEDSPKSKDFQMLQIDGILNFLWCSWRRFEEIAPHATILPANQPHWDISTCMKTVPRQPLARLFREAYWRYTVLLYDYDQVNLSQGDFQSEINKILPHHDSTKEISKLVDKISKKCYIPNELAQFLKGYSGTYENAVKAIPARYRTVGDKDEWNNRIAIWRHYSPLGVENSPILQGFQKLKSDGIRKYLWCMWQRYEEKSHQAAPAATLAKRPLHEPETFTPAAKEAKTTGEISTESQSQDACMTTEISTEPEIIFHYRSYNNMDPAIRAIGAVYFRFLFQRYVNALHDNEAEIDLSSDDLLNEIVQSVPDSSLSRRDVYKLLEDHSQLFTIPNELAAFLKEHANTCALEAVPARYRAEGDEEVWLNRIAVWKQYSPLGVENSPELEGFQTLKLDATVTLLWSMWQSYESLEKTKIYRRANLAAPILVHAASPPRRKENLVEVTDRHAAESLLAMKYQSTHSLLPYNSFLVSFLRFRFYGANVLCLLVMSYFSNSTNAVNCPIRDHSTEIHGRQLRLRSTERITAIEI